MPRKNIIISDEGMREIMHLRAELLRFKEPVDVSTTEILNATIVVAMRCREELIEEVMKGCKKSR